MDPDIAETPKRDLLQAVIDCLDGLNLSPEQEANLSRIHWSHVTGGVRPDMDEEVRSILTDRQLRFVLSGMAMNDRASVNRLIQSIVDQKIEGAIGQKLRSASMVESDIAEAVLNKLVGWAKLFGYFVAVPLGLMLLIFTLFGWKSFEDVRHAAEDVQTVIRDSRDEINKSRNELARNNKQIRENGARVAALNEQFAPLIARARGQVSQSSKDFSETEIQLRKILTDAQGRADASQVQLAELQRRLDANSRSLAALGSTVQKLATAVGIETTGALQPLAIPSTGRGRKAILMLNCGIGEYNQNVREGGGDKQIVEYLSELGVTGTSEIPWSGAFIGYCLNRVDATAQIQPDAANFRMRDAAKASGIWIANGPGVAPKPGDIYFIGRANSFAMQTGIVWRVFGSDFEGLEGNVQNRLLVVPRSLSTPRLEGFARLADR